MGSFSWVCVGHMFWVHRFTLWLKSPKKFSKVWKKTVLVPLPRIHSICCLFFFLLEQVLM